MVIKDKAVAQFIETVDYLGSKYQLDYRNSAKVVRLVEQKTQNSVRMESAIISVNKTVFCTGETLGIFLERVRDDYSIDIKDLARLVASNYIESSPPRNIFQSADTTGTTFLEECIDYIIRKVQKGDLFSDKLENYRPYELLIEVIFQREATAIIEWNHLVLGLAAGSSEGRNIYSKEALIQKLGTFLTVYIPSDFPNLHYILKYTYSSLLAKYSSHDSL